MWNKSYLLAINLFCRFFWLLAIIRKSTSALVWKWLWIINLHSFVWLRFFACMTNISWTTILSPARDSTGYKYIFCELWFQHHESFIQCYAWKGHKKRWPEVARLDYSISEISQHSFFMITIWLIRILMLEFAIVLRTF